MADRQHSGPGASIYSRTCVGSGNLNSRVRGCDTAPCRKHGVNITVREGGFTTRVRGGRRVPPLPTERISTRATHRRYSHLNQSMEVNSMDSDTMQYLWGIVLAGGDGTRVRDFLRQCCGGRGIKQFCAVIGQRSMLEHTLACIERLIPRERTLVVVSQDHRAEATPQLAHWPPENIIWQPMNRDTAPGVLLPLAHKHMGINFTVS